MEWRAVGRDHFKLEINTNNNRERWRRTEDLAGLALKRDGHVNNSCKIRIKKIASVSRRWSHYLSCDDSQKAQLNGRKKGGGKKEGINNSSNSWETADTNSVIDFKLHLTCFWSAELIRINFTVANCNRGPGEKKTTNFITLWTPKRIINLWVHTIRFVFNFN